MEDWERLSMADKAKYILLGVLNGVTDLDTIRQSYNVYAKGGNKQTYTRRKDIENYVASLYPNSYNQYPVNVILDNNFTPPGTGDIEIMLKEDAFYPLNNYTYSNPYPNENTIVFNNNIKNPNTAAALDYLHVLRKEDPSYQRLLLQLDQNIYGTDVMYNASSRYDEDKKDNNGIEVMPFNRYIENEEDGWLRNMFHPGTKLEMLEDNYYPDKTQLLLWNPSLKEPTREIYNYLHPYLLLEITVTPQSNKFDLGGGNTL